LVDLFELQYSLSAWDSNTKLEAPKTVQSPGSSFSE